MPEPAVHRRLSPMDSPAWTVLAAGATWMIGAAVFFRAQLSSGFDRIMGNSGDARLVVYLNEHWYQVLRGSQAWRDPAFFAPTRGVLGYTDTFFLWQIADAPLRLLGADPFLAFQLTLVVLTLVGFATFVALARTAFGATRPVACAAALVFAFPAGLEAHAGSPQLFGIEFVPGILLLSFVAWRTRASTGRSILLAALAGLLLSLLLFSTYYVAWLSMLAAAVVGLGMVLLGPRAALLAVRRGVRSGWRTIVAAAAGVAVGIIPFVVTYLPVVRSLGTRPYWQAMYYAPQLRDLSNVTSDNVVWGALLRPIWDRKTDAAYEISYALTPILIVTVTVGGALLLWGALSHRSPLDGRRRLTISLALTPVVLALLPVRTSVGSAWAVVWHLPGASGIRSIDRLQIAADLIAALALVALATDPWVRSLITRTPITRVAVAIVLALVVFEQVDGTSTTELVRSHELATIDAVPHPPVGCTTFYVVDRPNRVPFYADLTQAMLISQRLRLPTLDGYSGDQPPGWDLIYPASPWADGPARTWALAHGMTTGVCRLDLATDRWVGPLHF